MKNTSGVGILAAEGVCVTVDRLSKEDFEAIDVNL